MPIELTEEQILKIYEEWKDGGYLACRTNLDAFIRGIQYALRHIEGGKWVDVGQR